MTLSLWNSIQKPICGAIILRHGHSAVARTARSGPSMGDGGITDLTRRSFHLSVYGIRSRLRSRTQVAGGWFLLLRDLRPPRGPDIGFVYSRPASRLSDVRVNVCVCSARPAVCVSTQQSLAPLSHTQRKQASRLPTPVPLTRDADGQAAALGAFGLTSTSATLRTKIASGGCACSPFSYVYELATASVSPPGEKAMHATEVG